MLMVQGVMPFGIVLFGDATNVLPPSHCELRQTGRTNGFAGGAF